MATHENVSRTHDVKSSSHRSFGWVFAVLFLIIAAWPLMSGGGLRWWSVIVAAVFAVLAAVAPALLGPLNKIWLRFGLLLNRIVSPIVLGIMFYGVVTPIGWLMRATGKDPMRLRDDGKQGSYWIKRDPPGPKPDSLTNQF